jgi:hypothetical protein
MHGRCSPSFACGCFYCYYIIFLGLGNCGELARTADMGNIDRDTAGVFDMKKPHIKNNIYDLDFVRNQFLKPSPVRFAAGNPKKTVLNVACGSFHLLVVAREPHQFQSTLYSSGLNQYGQLGLGDGPARHELTPVSFLSLSLRLVIGYNAEAFVCLLRVKCP